jgi:hypothetical protein
MFDSEVTQPFQAVVYSGWVQIGHNERTEGFRTTFAIVGHSPFVLSEQRSQEAYLKLKTGPPWSVGSLSIEIIWETQHTAAEASDKPVVFGGRRRIACLLVAEGEIAEMCFSGFAWPSQCTNHQTLDVGSCA